MRSARLLVEYKPCALKGETTGREAVDDDPCTHLERQQERGWKGDGYLKLADGPLGRHRFRSA